MDYAMNESRSNAKAAGMMIGLAVSLLLGLPLLGIRLAGTSLDAYLDFPPLTRYVEHAGFSWLAFALMSMFIVACVLPFVMASWTVMALAAKPARSAEARRQAV